MKRNKTGIFTHLQRNLLNESPFYASAQTAKDKHEVSWTPNNGIHNARGHGMAKLNFLLVATDLWGKSQMNKPN